MNDNLETILDYSNSTGCVVTENVNDGYLIFLQKFKENGDDTYHH